jgi:hypothetical protein
VGTNLQIRIITSGGPMKVFRVSIGWEEDSTVVAG